jgi:23S rRNA pseudouridine1911/1915/1917 synthase
MKIIFENNDFLVINKPSGIMVHGDGRSTEETVADFVLEKYPEIKEVGEPMVVELNGEETTIYRPGIVHRLDKDTSGVLIVTKTQESFEYFKSQFKERQIKKTYNAIVWGHFKETEGSIDESIGRSASDFRRRSASRGKRGKLREAVTEYKVLGEFERDGEIFSYLDIYPRTGRTHQIRVHMQYIHHLIVCDPLYSGKKTCPIVGRLALHARRIEFTGPEGQRYDFEAQTPADMKETLAETGLL